MVLDEYYTSIGNRLLLPVRQRRLASAGGRILECTFLDCSGFLASSEPRNSDTVNYVTLQGGEFYDSIAEKWNPAFPEEDDEGECGVTFRNAGWCYDDSNFITFFTFETDTWSEGEDTQPVDEDESEDEGGEEDVTMRQGLFAFWDADLEGVPDEEVPDYYADRCECCGMDIDSSYLDDTGTCEGCVDFAAELAQR